MAINSDSYCETLTKLGCKIQLTPGKMVWHSPATAQQCASAVVLKILQIGTLMECTLEGPYTHNSAFCLQLSLVNKDKVSKTSVSYSEGCT